MTEMEQVDIVARTAYAYWASRGGRLSAARLREIRVWEKLPSETQEQWMLLAAAIVTALFMAADDGCPND